MAWGLGADADHGSIRIVPQYHIHLRRYLPDGWTQQDIHAEILGCRGEFIRLCMRGFWANEFAPTFDGTQANKFAPTVVLFMTRAW